VSYRLQRPMRKRRTCQKTQHNCNCSDSYETTADWIKNGLATVRCAANLQQRTVRKRPREKRVVPLLILRNAKIQNSGLVTLPIGGSVTKGKPIRRSGDVNDLIETIDHPH